MCRDEQETKNQYLTILFSVRLQIPQSSATAQKKEKKTAEHEIKNNTFLLVQINIHIIYVKRTF